MRPSIGVFLKDAIRVGGEPAIGEKHRLDPFAKLLVRQKQQRFPAGTDLSTFRHYPRLIIKHLKNHFMSVLLTFQVPTASESQVLRNIMSVSALTGAIFGNTTPQGMI